MRRDPLNDAPQAERDRKVEKDHRIRPGDSEIERGRVIALENPPISLDGLFDQTSGFLAGPIDPAGRPVDLVEMNNREIGQLGEAAGQG